MIIVTSVDNDIYLCLGHFVPSQGSWRKFLANYMTDPNGPHASPLNASVVVQSEDASHQAGSDKASLMMKL